MYTDSVDNCFTAMCLCRLLTRYHTVDYWFYSYCRLLTHSMVKSLGRPPFNKWPYCSISLPVRLKVKESYIP